MNHVNMKSLAVVAALALTMLLAACDGTGAQPTARQTANAAAENNQQVLTTAVPIPVLKTSLERQNLAERAKFLNNTAFVSCVYLYAENGSMVAFYPVKYKVSSLNSYMLPGDVVDWRSRGTDGIGSATQESPDIDGAYGQNADGIFFFTADTSEYVEWAGDYLYTSGCSKATSSTLLTQEVPNEDVVSAPTKP